MQTLRHRTERSPTSPRSALFSLSVATVFASLWAPELHAQGSSEERTPWRLNKALGMPEWLSLRGHHRLRYESLDQQFRASPALSGSDQVFAFRTSLELKADLDPVEFLIEGLDSRQQLADSGSFINTTISNAVELLQANATLKLADVFSSGDSLRILGGRHTFDVGSRRFTARNRYRNTINSFTGINAVWTDAKENAQVRAFWTLPVERLPRHRQGLLDNDIHFDEEHADIQFFGVYSTLHGIFSEDSTVELGFFGLVEDDSSEVATRDRRIFTPTTRVYNSKKPGQFDYEFEAALQFGKSRASTSSSDTTDLDHFAAFWHMSFGYTFEDDWRTRVGFDYDYVTGDDSPTDDNNNRFDTLFGARRFDFGPTGIFGAWARSNLVSPGYRITFKPHDQVGVMIAHRAYWLESSRDAWTTSGVRDASGLSGTFLGHMPEIRVRWDGLPGNIRLETGIAYIFESSFVNDAPNANSNGDSTYGYVQTVLTF